jgi:putative hydrolase of the HAD superfamily
MNSKRIEALIFDLGGVIIESPTNAVVRYEQDCNLPFGTIIQAMEYGNDDGITSKFEKSEINFDQYCERIQERVRNICSNKSLALGKFNAKDLVFRMESECSLRQKVLHIIDKLRQSGVLIAVITNNWYGPDSEHFKYGKEQAPLTNQELYERLKEHFDVFVESRVCGYRKPQMEIYKICLEELDRKRGDAIPRESIVYFDDIGRNLKPMKELGINTIKIESEEQLLNILHSLAAPPPPPQQAKL